MVLSLYIESIQRQQIYNFVTSATNYRGEREADAPFFSFLFFTTCAIPTPHHTHAGDVMAKRLLVKQIGV